MRKVTICFTGLICIMLSLVMICSTVYADSVSDREKSLKESLTSIRGNTDYNGVCGTCTAYQLGKAGLFSTSTIAGKNGWNGNDSYNKYKGLKPINGMTVTLFPGSNKNGKYTIKDVCDLLNASNTTGKNTYTIFCFHTGSESSAGQKYGHVLLVHAVYNGKVYWGESWGTKSRVESISSFVNTYKARTSNGKNLYVFDGAISYDYDSTPASTFAFQNVVYPKTFKINTSSGWDLSGGTLVCDKQLKTITTVITTADGKSTISGPKSYNISGYSYQINNLDTRDGSNNGVRFSFIKDPGDYIWKLTATDETGRELKLEMPFTAVSIGSTTTDEASMPCSKHTVVVDLAVAATCTKTGLTEGKHCSVCGTVLEAQTAVPALGHAEVVDAAVAATCTEAGMTEGKHCSRCGEVLVAQTAVAALGHKEVADAAVAATCTKDGLTEGSHCSVCNAVIKKQEKVAALGHKEVIDKAVEATYTSTGLTEGKHCERCGEVLVKQQEIAKLIPQTPEEKIKAFVTRCYKLILNRDPDADGLESWCKALKEKTATAAQIIDGFMESDEFKNGDSGDVITVLYLTMLNREPDTSGLTNWGLPYYKGVYTIQDIINGFCGSAEFTALCNDYGIEPGRIGVPAAASDTPRGKIEAFVRRCYKLILSRNADADGLKGWSDALEQRIAPAAQIIDGFVRSPEYINRKLSDGESVDILYNTMLDRDADESGRAGWVAALSQGYTLQHIINGFCGSVEFTGICNDYGITPGKLAVSSAMVKREAITPEGDETEAPIIFQGYNSEFINEEKVRTFVEHCYVAVFGREGDAEGITNYTQAILDGKKTPKKVAYEFIFSPEFQNNLPGNEEFIRILYRLYFNREADAEGLAGWVQMLENGTSLEDIVNGFAGSDEFKAIVNDMKE